MLVSDMETMETSTCLTSRSCRMVPKETTWPSQTLRRPSKSRVVYSVVVVVVKQNLQWGYLLLHTGPLQSVVNQPDAFKWQIKNRLVASEGKKIELDDH